MGGKERRENFGSPLSYTDLESLLLSFPPLGGMEPQENVTDQMSSHLAHVEVYLAHIPVLMAEMSCLQLVDWRG